MFVNQIEDKFDGILSQIRNLIILFRFSGHIVMERTVLTTKNVAIIWGQWYLSEIPTKNENPSHELTWDEKKNRRKIPAKMFVYIFNVYVLAGALFLFSIDYPK